MASIGNPYVPEVELFTNTKEFTYLADFFRANQCYTNIPANTVQYKEFWKDVRNKCLEGMTNSDGIKITGIHFFYLNFCPIERQIVDSRGRISKAMDFPKFVDLDYDYFWMVDYCRMNGKNLEGVKGRRQGWSYRAAALCMHEFYFYPDSRSIIGAFLGTFAETTMGFGLNYSNHLNSYTEFRKNRAPDLKDYVMARYQVTVGGVRVWKGYRSSVESITFKDKATAAVGKCLAKGTKVMMWDGSFKTVEDIVEGDLIMGPNSYIQRVMSTTKGVDQMYLVKQKKGKDYIVNSEHILYLEERGYGKTSKIHLIKPGEFLSKPESLQKRLYGVKTSAIDFKYSGDLELDPYFLGLWLGDGSSAKTEITSADIEIENYLINYAKDLDLHINKYIKENNKASAFQLNSYPGNKGKNHIRNSIKQLNLYNNKHIPFKYKTSSYLDRKKLLAGLIDSDGYKVRDNVYEIATISKTLCTDICFLARSLGLFASYRKKKTTCQTGSIGNAYRIFITGEMHELPVLLERKKSKYKKLTTNNLRTPITIEKAYVGEYYGFTLKKENLFILEDFTITHNSASWFILDEAGVFPNIINTYGYSEPLIKDGSTWTGSAIIFGSSGDMEAGCQYFFEMFTNPRKYNCLEFDDPENPQIKIGYFSTAIRGRWGTCQNPNSKWYKQPMVDEDGNSNQEAAFDDIMWLRELAKGGNDHKALHNVVTQFPLTYREAFLRNKGAVFASPEMLEWLGKVETTPSLRGEAQRGKLVYGEDNKLEWKIDESLEQITDFPVKAENKKDGCIVIWEHPERSEAGVPSSLYISSCDPYDQDKAETSTSLGSFFVYKRFYQANKTHDLIVAEYTGRPERADDFYENCRKLCIYYNSKCLYENNLKGLKGYFEQKNSLHYLYETPQILKDFIKDTRVNRAYGIHMSQQIKDQCEIYLKQWLYDEREMDGKKILNLHTIKSIPLLKELVAYDREGNFDRVIAFMLSILQTKELHRIHVEEASTHSTKTGDFLNKLYLKNQIRNNSLLQRR